MKKILLTQGQFALVDDEDYEHLSQWKWWVHKPHKTWYAARTRSKKEGTKKTIYMHNYLMGGLSDHKDHNGLNNRKQNLRRCTTQQNNFNTSSRKTSTSKYKGVCWERRRKKWRAAITFCDKYYSIGRYDDEVEAAKAYDRKAKDLFGEFALLNFK